MQPKTTVKFDKESFERIKRTALNMSSACRNQLRDPKFCSETPKEIGLHLTANCNLRCKHCFEWGNTGFNILDSKENISQELSIERIKEILETTESEKSNLFIWGGEPMVYTHWDQLMELISQYKRWSVICTNGLLIQNKIDSILKASENIVLLTSLDGFEEVNDKIRGKGNYRKTIEGIKLILELQKKRVYKGKQSVNCVISDDMIGRLYEFATFFEELGIDTLYLCYPWYISEDTAYQMDVFFEKYWPERAQKVERNARSWHSFSFHVSKEKEEELLEDIKKIISKEWKIRIRFQPAVELNEVSQFISGDNVPVQKRTHCLALSNRMDILNDGTVSACKLFKEFSVGNINESEIEEIWNNSEFAYMRSVIATQLMPACSKCVLLYLNGI